MEELKIRWTKRALLNYGNAMNWYQQNMGDLAASRFSNGIKHSLLLLSKMPTMGTKKYLPNSGDYKYYSFLAHPKFRILYRFTETTLVIVAIQASVMNN